MLDTVATRAVRGGATKLVLAPVAQELRRVDSLLQDRNRHIDDLEGAPDFLGSQRRKLTLTRSDFA